MRPGENMAIDVSSDTFDAEVLQSEVPVLVDFWGPQCAPCLALMPQVIELGEKLDGRLKVAKIDASKNRRFCLQLRVLALPTFLIYKNGEEVERLSSQDLTISEIDAAVAKVMGPRG
jgi:thioredoxin 1